MPDALGTRFVVRSRSVRPDPSKLPVNRVENWTTNSLAAWSSVAPRGQMTARAPAARMAMAIALALASLGACGGDRGHPNARSAAEVTAGAAPSDSSAAAGSSAGNSGEASSATSTPEAAEAAHVLPTQCASHVADVCAPPNAFVDRLCNGHFVDTTLVLFSKDSPWTRAYLKANVEAWYASGGASLKARLGFNEEVIVLRHRVPAKNGIIVGDGGGFDVVRWDGYCYTLDAENVTLTPPRAPKRALISFFKLGKAMQDAILSSPLVTAAYAKRMKECGGATAGEVTLACEKADQGLSTAAVDFVRGAQSLPPPGKIP